jgi:hypothetical protein
MSVADLSHENALKAIDLIGSQLIPKLRIKKLVESDYLTPRGQ